MPIIKNLRSHYENIVGTVEGKEVFIDREILDKLIVRMKGKLIIKRTRLWLVPRDKK